ncbi:hypothetical protein LINGRAPRIM_LOCUS1297 [Linum grandiflorum]
MLFSECTVISVVMLLGIVMSVNNVLMKLFKTLKEGARAEPEERCRWVNAV